MDMVEKVATALLEEDPTREGHYTWHHYEGSARAAIAVMPPAMEITDWFKRNADRKNPEAFINTNPEYFAQECASAIYAALGEGE